MEEEKKKLLFCLYFRHISPFLYSNFDQKSSLDAELNSASNEYPLDILLMNPATPKTRNTWKMWWWHHHHIFLGISCFWGIRVHQEYSKWVCVGCRIKFHIQQDFLIKIWVKTEGGMSKMRKNSFFFSSSKINKYYFIILTIILLIFLKRPILSWNFL